MKTVAITSMIAVPSVLTVIPRRIIRLETSSYSFNSSVVTFGYKGNVATEELAEMQTRYFTHLFG